MVAPSMRNGAAQWKVDEADAVVEVLDARDPLAFRSDYLEKEIAGRKKGKKVMLVVNKIGTFFFHLS